MNLISLSLSLPLARPPFFFLCFYIIFRRSPVCSCVPPRCQIDCLQDKKDPARKSFEVNRTSLDTTRIPSDGKQEVIWGEPSVLRRSHAGPGTSAAQRLGCGRCAALNFKPNSDLSPGISQKNIKAPWHILPLNTGPLYADGLQHSPRDMQRTAHFDCIRWDTKPLIWITPPTLIRVKKTNKPKKQSPRVWWRYPQWQRSWAVSRRGRAGFPSRWSKRRKLSPGLHFN